ncbi:MAG: hypothetical protein ABL940_10175 [Bacteroidia bacterium]
MEKLIQTALSLLCASTLAQAQVNNTNYNLYADGSNRSTSAPTAGVVFKCYTMTNTVTSAYDIAIQGGTSTTTKGIAATQGYFTNGAYQSYANIFSGTLQTGHGILNNANPIVYYGTVINGSSGTNPATIVSTANSSKIEKIIKD